MPKVIDVQDDAQCYSVQDQLGDVHRVDQEEGADVDQKPGRDESIDEQQEAGNLPSGRDMQKPRAHFPSLFRRRLACSRPPERLSKGVKHVYILYQMIHIIYIICT